MELINSTIASRDDTGLRRNISNISHLELEPDHTDKLAATMKSKTYNDQGDSLIVNWTIIPRGMRESAWRGINTR